MVNKMTNINKSKRIQSRLARYLNDSIVQNNLLVKDIEEQSCISTIRLRKLRHGEDVDITINELFLLIEVADLPSKYIFEGIV